MSHHYHYGCIYSQQCETIGLDNLSSSSKDSFYLSSFEVKKTAQSSAPQKLMEDILLRSQRLLLKKYFHHRIMLIYQFSMIYASWKLCHGLDDSRTIKRLSIPTEVNGHKSSWIEAGSYIKRLCRSQLSVFQLIILDKSNLRIVFSSRLRETLTYVLASSIYVPWWPKSFVLRSS